MRILWQRICDWLWAALAIVGAIALILGGGLLIVFSLLLAVRWWLLAAAGLGVAIWFANSLLGNPLW